MPSCADGRARALTERFGDADSFLTTVTPEAQMPFAEKPVTAVMGDYPTLAEIARAYGRTFPVQWLIPQIVDMSLFTGVRNITKEQQVALAQTIVVDYYYLKVTELMLFFFRFKSGKYGHFYGSFDPQVVTVSLREFISERNDIIWQVDQEESERKRKEGMVGCISYEEWKRRKQLKDKQNENNQI